MREKMSKKNKKEKNILISEYTDTQAMSTLEIMDNFSSWLKQMDGSKLTTEQRKKIVDLLENNRILRILCAAMYEVGYESF